ncbi:MAG: hypothetical protein J6O70_02955 [Lachnospiraceae bacterium]|nr:hypothetical protein [Lachnospiraceae bacterium]
MNIEIIRNPKTGILEAWEDGKAVGEFITTGMLIKDWKLTDCIVRKEQRPTENWMRKYQNQFLEQRKP